MSRIHLFLFIILHSTRKSNTEHSIYAGPGACPTLFPAINERKRRQKNYSSQKSSYRRKGRIVEARNFGTTLLCSFFFDNHRCSSSIAQTVAQTAKPCCAGVFPHILDTAGRLAQLAQHFSSLIYMTYMHMKGYIFSLAYVRVKKSCVVVPINMEPREHARKGWAQLFFNVVPPFLRIAREPREIAGNVWHNKVVPKSCDMRETTETHALPTVYSESNSASSEARCRLCLYIPSERPQGRFRAQKSPKGT